MKTAKAIVAAIGVASLLGIFANASEAAVINTPGGLNLSTQVHDVNLAFESINYTITGSTATLTASVTGDIGSLDFGASTITNGSIALTVNFTQSGSTYLATGGSMIVAGKIGAVQQDFFNSTNLLKFGFSENAQQPQTLEFVFGPGTGTYGAGGFGVILHSALNNAAGGPVVPNNNFNTPFSNSQSVATANSDTFSLPVPEPASLALLGLGAPALLRRRRR